MKKYLSLLAAIFFFSSVQPASASYLYTFSSGDILDRTQRMPITDSGESISTRLACLIRQ